MDTVFALHVLATLLMTGAIWFVQIVHYPLFAKVGSAAFVAYERAHTRRTGIVVMPLMLTELATGIAICFVQPPAMPQPWPWVGLTLIALIWLITFFYFVPMHRRLSQHFDATICQHLVRRNWTRTLLWSLRAGILLWLAHYSSP